MARNNRRFGPADRAVVITQLLAGATVAAAARAAGFAVQTLYDDRKRCPLFARAWADAVATGGRGWSRGGRAGWWQIKRLRRNRFTRDRKDAFLSELAVTCEVGEAARAAGVCRATAYAHRVSDPAFAAAWRKALECGVAVLEGRLLEERLVALEDFDVEAGDFPAPAASAEEREQEFWRSLELLRTHRRALAGVPDRRPRGRRPRVASREEVHAEMAKALAAFERRCRQDEKWGTPRSKDP
ncbi:hypothetical protein [Allosphingosinicella sp.]|uniref:hypothetical protein n=1 Tax=Allosphingosinicella sp. TaxID=2823234 RepID=UPI0037832C6A